MRTGQSHHHRISVCAVSLFAIGSVGLFFLVRGHMGVSRRIVYLEWLDAVGCAGSWEHEMTLKEVDGWITTIGFVLDENEDFVFVSGHLGKDQQQGGMAIPKTMIRKWFDVEFI